ncbi:membrane-bound lytic murein transglycosylase MltF [Catenovulum sp. 2E275]|uniref:membrane-bound lytic murein transglycosylase MltF n=1 Tax=Catenovulum sp. 2E275 TaxID=2980497 RepID=UPI0021D02025|nr:membrane-bound lytic murein transglycosylase MltF [Catenovulum sp. 2E275]MCU4674668.1 membrane-bound lytic murein transglycosylase MltF [Catenovulum sp. 2E275]
MFAKKIIKYAIFLKLFSSLVLATLLSACQIEQNKTQAEMIGEKNIIRVGTIYGPTSYYLTSDGPAGFEYELAQEFAHYLNVELEIIPVYDLAELFNLLENNQVDVLAASLTATQARKEKYRFAPTYQYISEKLVFKQGNERPRDWQDITGKLRITAKSSHQETLEKLNLENLEWQTTNEQDAEELIQAVLNGEIDYTIVDSNVLAVNRRIYPNLSIGFTVSDELELGWAFAKQKDDSLYALLIDFFGSLHQSGEFARIEDKYFGHVKTFDYVDTRTFIEAIENTLPKYQNWFETYAKQYELDWRLLAAQSYQESHWDPKAKSPTGVRGIMMLTLPTAKQMGVKSRLHAEDNIKGGARYFSSLHNRIPDRITEPDRTWFALAAYNIGLGHLEDARKIAQGNGANPDKWHQVKVYLPLLQKKKYYKNTRYGYARGNEAVTYVENIRRYYDSLVWFFGPNHSPALDTELAETIESAEQSAKADTSENPASKSTSENADLTDDDNTKGASRTSEDQQEDAEEANAIEESSEINDDEVILE